MLKGQPWVSIQTSSKWCSWHGVNDVDFCLYDMPYGKSDENDLNEPCVLSDSLIRW